MSRLRFIPEPSARLAACVILLLLAGSRGVGQAPSYDLLIKGGHVLDPANNVDAVLDVAVSAGKIAAVAKDIPAAQAKKVVDAKGLYIVPGLVDIHYHIGHGGAAFPPTWL